MSGIKSLEILVMRAPTTYLCTQGLDLHAFDMVLKSEILVPAGLVFMYVCLVCFFFIKRTITGEKRSPLYSRCKWMALNSVSLETVLS